MDILKFKLSKKEIITKNCPYFILYAHKLSVKGYNKIIKIMNGINKR